MGPSDCPERLPRRDVLGRTGAALLGGAVAGLAACADDSAPGSPAPLTGVASEPGPSRTISFRGGHQAGITAPPAAASLAAAFDVRVDGRGELTELFATLTETIEHVMDGTAWDPRPGGFPPADTGILGEVPGATGTSVVVGLGDSLFRHPDHGDRFGLDTFRPVELEPMPRFANDSMVGPERSHGDVSIVVQADHADATAHALRQILRVTRGRLVPRWAREGFQHVRADPPEGGAPGRNLMGFLDGTVNPRAAAELADAVWIGANDGQPEWAVGGTYQAIRVIRMMVEFWDRTRLSEQEAIFARHRDSGAPLGKAAETDHPEFDEVSMTSHIARANPRTPGSPPFTMLRRGFNYSGGIDGNDQLDQGLVFVSYQRSLERGFLGVQRRLDGEALEEYVRPLGGGLFVVPRAPAPGEIIAEALLAG